VCVNFLRLSLPNGSKSKRQAVKDLYQQVFIENQPKNCVENKHFQISTPLGAPISWKSNLLEKKPKN
jgi:hypothetical protein